MEFDPKKVSYRQLIELFFDVHNPTQVGGQGADIGDQYRSVIFCHSAAQMETAKKVRDEVAAKLRRTVVTQIVGDAPFYMAEDYHQQYYLKTGVAACPIPTKKGGG